MEEKLFMKNNRGTINWSYIDIFLIKERDSFYSSVTHIKLATAAIISVIILLCVHSIIVPYIEYAIVSKTYNTRFVENIYLTSMLVTSGCVLLLAVFCVYKVYSALVHSLTKELRSKVSSIKNISSEYGLSIPFATQDLISGIQNILGYDDFSGHQS